MVNRKDFLFTLMFILMIFSCSTYKTTVEKIQNDIRIETAKLNVKVQFYANDVVCVVKWLPGALAGKTSLVVIRDTLPNIKVKFQENSEAGILSSEKVTLNISNIQKRWQNRIFDSQ